VSVISAIGLAQGERGVRLASRSQRWLATPARVVALGIISAGVLLPFAWMLTASVRPESDIVANPWSIVPNGFTLSHYVDIWSQIPFAHQIVNTVVYAGGVTALSLLFDSMTAYALARFDFPGSRLLFIVIIATMMIPFQVTLIPIFISLTNLHWVNSYQGLILPRATSAFGIFFLRQFFLSLPKDLEDAARVDGASEIRIFWRIMLPLAAPALLTLGLFHLVYNWNDLLWPLIVSTDASMSTLTAGLSQLNGEHATQYGVLMAGSVIALSPMVVAFLLIQRRFVEGIATTGLK
jgi:multiple sugar transport system permease protein